MIRILRGFSAARDTDTSMRNNNTQNKLGFMIFFPKAFALCDLKLEENLPSRSDTNQLMPILNHPRPLKNFSSL
jgi:hypothetical protein